MSNPSNNRNWQLMTVEAIAEALQAMYEAGNTLAFRVQKSYYKKKNNAIMVARFEAAEALLKTV